MFNRFKIYEVDQRLIDFLRGDGEFANRQSNEIDRQVYSHYESIEFILINILV